MRSRFAGLNILLILIAAAGYTGGRGLNQDSGRDTPSSGNFLDTASLPYRNWSCEHTTLSADDRDLLRPEAYTVRTYTPPSPREAPQIQLAVVAGREKRSVHTPAFCMAGGGWETVVQRKVSLRSGALTIPATQSVLNQRGVYILTTYFFTNGSYASDDLLSFQEHQLLDRLRGRRRLGALVRIVTPIRTNERDSGSLTQAFASTIIPGVLASLREHE